eukprot:2886336-Amphidinium_carterae.3
MQRYKQAIRAQVDKGIIPGFCCLALKGNTVLHLDAYGYADRERRVPFATDSIVRIYCMGKAIVGTALMILVDQGRCQLDEPVARYIPAFSTMKVVKSSVNPSEGDKPLQKPITLRHLLTHTSGLGYGKELNMAPESAAEKAYLPLVNSVERGEVDSLEDFCNALAQLPL